MQTGLTVAELMALIEVGKLMNAELDLAAVLNTVMNVATDLMQAEASALVFVDSETGDLLFHTVQGDKARAVKQVRLRSGEGIVGSVIESGEAYIANYASDDTRFYSGVDSSTGFNTKSVLCVPLMTEHRRWGAIEILNKADNRPFDNHDLLLCEALAGQASVAIELAFLHEQKMKAERMAAIGETVAGLAHCVKNVLNGIQGGAYFVDRGLKNEDMPSISKGWQTVKKYSAFMMSLTLDMLTFAKEREPEYENTDVNDVIETVCEMSAAARAKGVSLAWEENNALRSVVIDPTGIRRCLLNLVSNAVDACPSDDGGRVRVTSEVENSTMFRIVISDNGSGISDEDKKNLFKTFFSTKGSKGTGLGLAVTQKIVSEHGGRIEVESSVGKGTSFSIVLPFEVKDGDSTQSEVTEKSNSKEGTHS